MTKQTFYGLRAHLRVCWPGVIVEVDLVPANAHDELRLAEELLEDAKGWALGHRNYWSPDPSWLVQKRRRIETVISQMAERYRAKKVWARDRWHLTSR